MAQSLETQRLTLHKLYKGTYHQHYFYLLIILSWEVPHYLKLEIQMKLCINCKHYVVDDSLPKTKYSRCGRNWRISPVDGEKFSLEQLPFCSVERLANSIQYCGQEGTFFEENTNV